MLRRMVKDDDVLVQGLSNIGGLSLLALSE